MVDPVSRLNRALVGRYRIDRKLGEGGMATVYLADDLRHERKVALKVLKPELAAVVGAERFLAEIKTTANLQHPHILPLFDSGEADGSLFYVMPYVEGETLRDRLDRERQLPVDEAVRVASNVAEALDYAHRRGVIHRDIKPANILLQDGKPVVSDFGIALAVSASGAGRLTETGLSLGTPHYMSPEQATGDHTVGPATDIWALGCVLYEMLVSEPPYTGGTPQAVLGKIVTSEPERVTKHRRSVPRNVDAAIRRALEKVPADRFAGAAAFARALTDRAFTHGEVAGVGGVRGAWNRLSVGLAALAALMMVLAAWGWLARPVTEPGVPTRAEIVGVNLSMVTGGWRLAISRDGRWIAAAHREEGRDPALYVRSSTSTEWRRLPGTEMATNPSFSPDGAWIAFDFSGNREGIFKVSVTGGTPLAVAALGREPHWTEDDQIVYRSGNEVLMVAGSGGEPRVLFRSDSIAPVRPHALPGGRAVLFGTGTALTSRIMLYDLRTEELRELSTTGTHPRFVPTGHVLYAHGDGTLMAVRFDLGTLATIGSPVPVLTSMRVGSGGAAQLAVADNGTVVYWTGMAGQANSRRLVWVNRDGSQEAIGAAPRPYLYPRVSPDGTRVAVSVSGNVPGRANVWIWNLASNNELLVTPGDGRFTDPAWSEDGTRIVYSDLAGGIYAKAPNNTGTPELLVQVETGGDAGRQPSPYFALGGSAVVYHQVNATTGADLVMWSLDGDSVVWRLDGLFNERNAVLHPNARWMAYHSNEAGQLEVYVRPFPNVHDDQVPVSTGGGADPVWSRDGRELFYLQPNQEGWSLVSVSVDPDASSVSSAIGERGVLMPWPYYVGLGRTYDVAPSGRFLAIAEEAVEQEEVYIVTNWFEELRERAGN